ncbi:MAG: hypothetical protein J0M25_05595, partial [Flavobacteriales bacterium]|nr:hypothetical protein [Flavobacteriales bacterium]
MKKLLIILVLWLFCSQNTAAQCFEIEAIYVDACGGQEGFNEMVRFKVGSAPINTSTLSVTWPSNAWQGLIQNAATANVVSALNADVIANGGCGQILQPTGGVLPANALVYLVTGENYDVTLNSFGALMDTVYILFQNNTTVTAGHFGNAGTGFRTLIMSFGACTDQVTYDRTLLVDQFGANIAADGATVLFTPSGQATYTNLGCVAPINPFYAIANPDSVVACAGSTINLTSSVAGQQSFQWSAPVGSLSNVNSLATSYTIPASATGTITVTLTATNSCGLTTSDQVTITVTPAVTPDFVTSATYCTGSAIPALVNTSPNGITGTWSPATVNNTTSGSYVFTPNPNQCATPVTLNVTITNSIVPNFATSATYCTGSSIPALVNTSPNGITGTWSPATVSNTASGSYVFTPNPNQCATPVTLNVTITNSIVPNFATSATYCTGSAIPALVNTSPNGITGTWNPATVSNTASGSYLFTPNPNQCATPVTLNVTITNSIVPNFATSATY